MLAKDRRFTMAAVVALGLGIGVNNSVFAIIDATLFRDAPFDRGDQLLSVHVVDSRGQGSISLPELRDLQESTRAFQALAASTGAMVNLSDPERRPNACAAPMSPPTLAAVTNRSRSGTGFPCR